MYSYSLVQWLFVFYFYCFFGWCFESTYVSIRKKKWVNRGFMRGPFLPLYGSGAVMMLLVSRPFSEHVFLVYLAGCVGATVLEYVTGVVMEALFKVRYWDYSNQKFNFQGHICLSSSLAWGFLTILMTRVVHKPVENFMYMIPSGVLSFIVFLLTLCIAGDFAISFKAAIDLRNILIRMENVKKDMARIQRRLDVVLALADEEHEKRKAEYEQRKEEFAEEWEQKLRIDELKERIETSIDRVKVKIHNKPSEYREELQEELFRLSTQYNVAKELRKWLSDLHGRMQRSMIQSNPTMRSVKYKEAFEELKQHIEAKKAEKKETEKKEEK